MVDRFSSERGTAGVLAVRREPDREAIKRNFIVMSDEGGRVTRVIEKPQHSPHYQYHLHDPADPKSHRRSVYRFVVRSQPQPMLTTLDCADPSMSVPERDESTTALQALTQWNNRFVEEMSGRTGEQLAAHASLPVPEQVARATRLVLGRAPSPEELNPLSNYLENHGEANFARLLFNLNAFLYVD